MSRGTVQYKKFTCPPDYIKEDVFPEICSEDLENDDIELWFIQTPNNVNLSKVDNQCMQHEGRSSFQCEDGEVLKCNAVKYKCDSLASEIHCVVPSKKNGALVAAKKKFAGHILFTKSVCIPPFGEKQQLLPVIKKECSSLENHTASRSDPTLPEDLSNTPIRKKIKKEPISHEREAVAVSETNIDLTASSSNLTVSEANLLNIPTRKKIKKERISPENQAVTISKNNIERTSQVKLSSEDHQSNDNQPYMPLYETFCSKSNTSPFSKKAGRQSTSLYRNQHDLSEVPLNFPVKVKKEPISSEDESGLTTRVPKNIKKRKQKKNINEDSVSFMGSHIKVEPLDNP